MVGVDFQTIPQCKGIWKSTLICLVHYILHSCMNTVTNLLICWFWDISGYEPRKMLHLAGWLVDKLESSSKSLYFLRMLSYFFAHCMFTSYMFITLNLNTSATFYKYIKYYIHSKFLYSIVHPILYYKLLVTWHEQQGKRIPKFHLYISKVIHDILSGTT